MRAAYTMNKTKWILFNVSTVNIHDSKPGGDKDILKNLSCSDILCYNNTSIDHEFNRIKKKINSQRKAVFSIVLEGRFN